MSCGEVISGAGAGQYFTSLGLEECFLLEDKPDYNQYVLGGQLIRVEPGIILKQLKGGKVVVVTGSRITEDGQYYPGQRRSDTDSTAIVLLEC